MKPHIEIISFPDDDMVTCLSFRVSNGRTLAMLDNFYISSVNLIAWADALEKFPRHREDVFLFQVGSENPDDKWQYYFQFRAFTTDSLGHSALHFRFNNNKDLPEREVSELCVKAEPSQINNLGKLFREFAKLNHSVLRWWVENGMLYETIQDAEFAKNEESQVSDDALK